MWFVIRVFFKNGQQSNSIQAFDTEVAAQKRYYSICATDVDDEAMEYELVQIIRADGVCVASNIFDHRVVE